MHTLDKLFQETMVNKGLKSIDDPYGGDVSFDILIPISLPDSKELIAFLRLLEPGLGLQTLILRLGNGRILRMLICGRT